MRSPRLRELGQLLRGGVPRFGVLAGPSQLHCTASTSRCLTTNARFCGLSSSRDHQHNREKRTITYHSRFHRSGIVTFKLADIGEGIAEVELLKNFKKVGDDVEEMEQVCEVQSDKAAVEITSRFTGKVVKIHHQEGDIIKIGGDLMDIEVEGDEGTIQAASSASSSSNHSSAATPSSKAAVEKSKDEQGGGERGRGAEANVLAPPMVRRLAKEKGVDLGSLQGTGPNGRITREDVEKAATGGSGSTQQQNAEARQSGSTSLQSGVSSSPPREPVVPSRPSRDNKEVPLRGFARAMVKSMKEALEVPHLNVGEEIDVTRLITLRKSLLPRIEKETGLRLTLTSFLLKAMSLALNDYPILNSKFDVASSDKYTQYGSHNISIAMDTANGLVVPVLKNCESLTILEIQNNLNILQSKAKSNKLDKEDLAGGTISLSNVGVVGGTYVHPLLFDGQAGILAVGRVMEIPRLSKSSASPPHDDTAKPDWRIAKVMNVGLSADHRHVDGATAARYITRLKEYLEDPGSMLLRMT